MGRMYCYAQNLINLTILDTNIKNMLSENVNNGTLVPKINSVYCL